MQLVRKVDVEVMDGMSRPGKIFLIYNSIEVLRKRHGQKSVGEKPIR